MMLSTVFGIEQLLEKVYGMFSAPNILSAIPCASRMRSTALRRVLDTQGILQIKGNQAEMDNCALTCAKPIESSKNSKT